MAILRIPFLLPLQILVSILVISSLLHRIDDSPHPSASFPRTSVTDSYHRLQEQTCSSLDKNKRISVKTAFNCELERKLPKTFRSVRNSQWKNPMKKLYGKILNEVDFPKLFAQWKTLNEAESALHSFVNVYNNLLLFPLIQTCCHFPWSRPVVVSVCLSSSTCDNRFSIFFDFLMTRNPSQPANKLLP